MQESELPEVRFDENRAVPCFPRPEIKYAVLVPFYAKFAINIRPEWDKDGKNPQSFIGDFYLIFHKDGRPRYGSAKEQWENMHVRVGAFTWIKVLVPTGYHVDEACNMVTWITDEETGRIEESRTSIEAGTLVIKQPGGEFQFVRPEDEAKTYYTTEEARGLGLHDLTIEEFGRWAVNQAKAMVST